MEQTQDKAALALMEKLTVEASRLVGCIKLLNHDVHKAMLAGKLDPSLANTHKLGTAFYTNLTVSVCSVVMYTQPLQGSHLLCDAWVCVIPAQCAVLDLALGLLADAHQQSCKAS